MDYNKIKNTIKNLRLEKHLTQKQLAQKLNITEQAISKWERGLGMPDISICSQLADILGVNINVILTGEIEENERCVNHIKNLNYYICPICSNVIVSTEKATISCCGRPLELSTMQKVTDSEKMTVTTVEDEYFITCDHPMTKEDYISFTAFVYGEKVLFTEHFPEWNLEVHIPKRYHGKFIFYSKKGGLKYQLI